MLKDFETINQLLNESSMDRNRIVRLLDSRVNSSLENDICISKLDDERFKITVRNILEEINNPFVCKNEWDTCFYNLIKELRRNSVEQLVSTMKQKFEEYKPKLGPENTKNFIEYFDKYKFWGSFNPDLGDYTTFILRAENLKMHSYDYLHLYKLLEDYMSKRTLLSILLNWAYLDMYSIYAVKSIFKDYFEPDLFPDNVDDVLVDCGAYIGDSIINYVNAYGIKYKKIYAYEISKNTVDILDKNMKANKLHDVIIRNKGVGDESGYMYLENNEETSAIKLSSNTGSEKIEVVKIDDDIDDVITFIKMDIEGAEKSAILGAKKTIKEHTPKLVICVYHGYDDLLDLPELIQSINSNYKFYLRHNGGNMIPTEFVLLCKPNLK